MNGFEQIGKKVRFYRVKKGLSKPEFAKQAGISLTKLEDIEKGLIVYQFKTLEKLAKVLEIDLPELLDF